MDIMQYRNVNYRLEIDFKAKDSNNPILPIPNSSFLTLLRVKHRKDTAFHPLLWKVYSYKLKIMLYCIQPKSRLGFVREHL